MLANVADVLSPQEVDAAIAKLKPFVIEDVGTEVWKCQREVLDRLNQQSHINIAQQKGDTVLDALLSQEKISVLIHELIIIHTWLSRIWSQECVRKAAHRAVASLLYCQTESILVNLFESIMFTKAAVVAADDDLLELIDYCVAQLVWLVGRNPNAKGASAPSAADLAKSEEQVDSETEVNRRFAVAMACISVLWNIIDKIGNPGATGAPSSLAGDGLPMGVLSRVLTKHDVPLLIGSLLTARPWLRRCTKEGGKVVTQKWVEGQWVDSPDVFAVEGQEGQLWLMLHVLLCDPECRSRYQYDAHRKETILATRKWLTEKHMDQIPALMEVQRALDELTIRDPPLRTDDKFKTSLIVEPVATYFEESTRNKNWPALGATMAARFKNSLQEDMMRLAKHYEQYAM